MTSRSTVLTSVSGGVLPVDAQRHLIANGLTLVPWSRTTKSDDIRQRRAVLMIFGAQSHCFADHLEDLLHLRSRRPGLPAIALVGESSQQTLLAALRRGVTDYLPFPYTLDDLLERVRAAIRTSAAYVTPDGESAVNLIGGERMVGSSGPLAAVRRYIAQVAETASNVLITGDTGTGKELAAELIHRNSRRRDRAFVCINCAAVPETLLEAELFGYERGAFTGAFASNEGMLASAHRGTVFFDEIGDMSPTAQAKILRVIESKQVSPLGSRSTTPSDFRVIAATNRTLEDMVDRGDFRRDLFFRLNVARIHLPPLRERKEDILALLNHCISEFNAAAGAAVEGCTGEALEALLRYDWPGNVRELRNLVEAIFVTCRRGRISPADIPPHFWRLIAGAAPASESAQLLAALFETQWNVSRAAEKLRWSRMTLYRKMEKYSISRCHKS
jgi:DNA-binding NtrC family response regulator